MSVLASVTGKKDKSPESQYFIDFLLFDAAVDVQQCAMGNMIITSKHLKMFKIDECKVNVVLA